MKADLTVERCVARSSVLALAISLTAVAQAQPEPRAPVEDPSVVAAARALAVEGVKLAQDGRCAEAIPKLERAEQLRHSAIVLSQLGECYIAMGRYVEGTEAMHAVLREGEPENPSEAMKRAISVARTELEPAKAKIAMLTISIEAVAGVQPSVSVDGQPVPPALIGAARPTNPGEHTIEAVAPGFLPARRRVTLAPGETDSVTLALVQDPRASRTTDALATGRGVGGVSAGAAEARGPLQLTAANAARPNRLPAFIAWGAGAAALATGVAFGWVALDQKSDLDRVCPNKRCPPEHSARLDAAKTNGVVSTVAVGVGIGAIALGGVLFFLAADAAEESQPTAAAGVGFDGSAVQLTF